MNDPKLMNPAQHLVCGQIRALMDEVEGAIRTFPDALPTLVMDSMIAKCVSLMDHTIRMMVHDGMWAEAGITDVRELYDLEVSIKVTPSANGRMIAFGVEMPHVMAILRSQDDPNAN